MNEFRQRIIPVRHYLFSFSTGSRIHCSTRRCVARTFCNVTQHTRSLGTIQNCCGCCKYHRANTTTKDGYSFYIFPKYSIRNGNIIIGKLQIFSPYSCRGNCESKKSNHISGQSLLPISHFCDGFSG